MSAEDGKVCCSCALWRRCDHGEREAREYGECRNADPKYVLLSYEGRPHRIEAGRLWTDEFATCQRHQKRTTK